MSTKQSHKTPWLQQRFGFLILCRFGKRVCGVSQANEATLQIPYKSSSCSRHPEMECPWIERNMLFPGTTCNCLSLVSFVESDFSLGSDEWHMLEVFCLKVCCFISWMLLNKVSSFQKPHCNELFAGYHWWIHKIHWKHQLSLSNSMAWIFITFYLLYVYSISWTGKNSKMR